MSKIPQWLQPTLWSVSINNLNIDKDKSYIINQILVYGGFRELKWLFRTYPKKIIRSVFIHHPIKIYTPQAFNFAKEILLNIKNQNLKPEKYDRNLPRFIRY